MANLSDEKRAEIRTEIARVLSQIRESTALSKTEWRAAVDAADGWVQSNKVSYNSALPAAAQSGLTATQKARLLAHVVQKRFTEGA